MKRPSEIAQAESSMAALADLTGVFEGIASMRIANIKDQVQQSSRFFTELWSIYSQIRVGSSFKFGRDADNSKVIEKELLIIITSEGGFSGDIDQKLIELMLKTYQSDKNDILVLGHHGAMQLAQRGVPFKKYFRIPEKDINVMPIIHHVQQYQSTKVFYQEYISLMIQDVKQIELSAAVRERGSVNDKQKYPINELTYIFEPSTYAVTAHLERSMMQIAISQVILESKLAQYASRFRAMGTSHKRADETRAGLHLEYNRARRSLKDERLKEIINGIKKARSGVGV